MSVYGESACTDPFAKKEAADPVDGGHSHGTQPALLHRVRQLRLVYPEAEHYHHYLVIQVIIIVINIAIGINFMIFMNINTSILSV
jgi:hypothetical protein